MVFKPLLPTESFLTIVKGGYSGSVFSYINNALSQNINSRDNGDFQCLLTAQHSSLHASLERGYHISHS